MNVRWFTTTAISLLLALAIHSAGTVPKSEYSQISDTQAPLHFSQTVAPSALLSAGQYDEARLLATGSRKAVPIILRGAPTRSFLHFLSGGCAQGSLLAQDIDDDGATDLVWRDLLRTNNEIVWLGDGSVEFERLANSEYTGAFPFGDSSAGAPADSNEEPAINFETYRPLDHAIIPKCIDRAATQLPFEDLDRITLSPPTLDQPADRGPPRF